DIIRLDGNRRAAALEPLLLAAKRDQRRAAIIVRLGIFGFQLEGLVEARNRVLVAFERIEDETVIEQYLRRWLARGHGCRDQTQGLGRLASRQLDQSHHLKSVKMIRFDRQD